MLFINGFLSIFFIIQIIYIVAFLIGFYKKGTLNDGKTFGTMAAGFLLVVSAIGEGFDIIYMIVLLAIAATLILTTKLLNVILSNNNKTDANETYRAQRYDSIIRGDSFFDDDYTMFDFRDDYFKKHGYYPEDRPYDVDISKEYDRFMRGERDFDDDFDFYDYYEEDERRNNNPDFDDFVNRAEEFYNSNNNFENDSDSSKSYNSNNYSDSSYTSAYDPYEILGVSINDDEKTVDHAYRMKSLKVHPDQNDDEDASKKFDELTKAYKQIKEKFH